MAEDNKHACTNL